VYGKETTATLIDSFDDAASDETGQFAPASIS